MKTRPGWTMIGIIGLALLAGAAAAQSAPQLINYQGRLSNSEGMPTADGATVDLTFRFYSAASDGALFLTILQENEVVTGGMYNVLIGSGTLTPGTETSLANVFRNHSEVWLGVAVDAEAEMTPRSRVASVPYALNDTGATLSEIEEFLQTPDFDGDGHNKTSYSGDDCNDGEAQVYPGAPEVCDGIDNQCAGSPGYGQVDEGCGPCDDQDGDGRGLGSGCILGPDCNDEDENNWDSCLTCDDLDGDAFFAACDAYVTIDGPDCDDLDVNNWDSCLSCDDLDGDSFFGACDTYVTIDGPDCDDLDVNNWDSCLSCDDQDNDSFFVDCDAYVTIGGPDCDDLDINNWNSCLSCNDQDGDDFFVACDAYVTIDGPDCDDLEVLVHPGSTELCDGIDNNCVAGIDEGCPPPGTATIPSGCFNMGDSSDSCIYTSAECPVHNVCITSSFYMDIHEVTNAEYKACVDASACTAPGNFSSYTRGSYYGNPTYNNFPVIYVSWDQATAYCAWAGKRLPTEAEWEYAARGGLAGKRYPNGDSISCADANYYTCASDTSMVGSYAANGYGLEDMVGNVWELTKDWSSTTYYSESPINNPQGPATGTSRVMRGGAWGGATSLQRVACRGGAFPTSQFPQIGFRCVGD